MNERRRYSIEKQQGAGGPLPSAGAVAPIFEHFHTFKEFMQLQADSLEPGVAVGLYDQYKYDYKVFSSRKMFLQALERRTGFVCDRYAPANLQEMCKRKIRLARTAAQSFLADLDTEAACASFELFVASSATSIPGLNLVQHTSGRIIGTIPSDVSGADVTVKGEESSADAPSRRWPAGAFTQPVNPLCTLILRKLPCDVTLSMLEELCTVEGAGAGEFIPGFIGATLIPSCLTEEHRNPLMLQASKDIQDCTEAEQNQIQHSLSECYIRAKGGALFPLLTGWLEFDSEEHCRQAEIMLDQKSIGDITLAKPQRLRVEKTRSINIVSAASEERLRHELELAKRLIQKLDREFHVYDQGPFDQPDTIKGDGAAVADDDKDEKADEEGKNEDFEMDEGIKLDEELSDTPSLFLQALGDSRPVNKALDLCVHYLRKVHLTDFYCAKICWTVRELVECCGVGSVRVCYEEDVCEMSLCMSQLDADDFDKRIYDMMQLSYTILMSDINQQHPLFENSWTEFADENTVRVDDEKYRCGICKKLFKGCDFVHKHIRNKHVEEIEKLKNEIEKKIILKYFEVDEKKLLLFIPNSTDFIKLKKNQAAAYLPLKKNHYKHTPLDKPFRDWDAPRMKLEERSNGGNFRKSVRYDDL